MAYIKSFKNQNWLLPPGLCDLIPKDHVCLLIESFIDDQDFLSWEFLTKFDHQDGLLETQEKTLYICTCQRNYAPTLGQ